MTTSDKGRTSILVLGDQLSPRISSLQDSDPDDCRLLMVETRACTRDFPCHKHKLILVWSAMRHRPARWSSKVGVLITVASAA
ncbi:MAG TPA: cryptochrome/photolyase family protein, partial [Acidobacteriota bacterium]|nr:cryptochrome/photolyase family protein [Acidobacteriota bacterium]